MSESFRMTAIGTVRSCFREKFGVPRQPGLCPHARGHIEMHAPWDHPDYFRSMEDFSHLWITFVFHEVAEQRTEKPLVRPPRMGGNQRVGALASRSPFRPNRLGLSLVQQDGLTTDNDAVRLHISGLDLIDGTPVLDIKPYLPWSDHRIEATAAWASAAPEPEMPVHFTDAALAQTTELEADYPDLAALIREVLSQDPRPAYHAATATDRVYGVALYDLNIRWRITNAGCRVETVERGSSDGRS